MFAGNSTDATITYTTGQAAGGDGVDVSVTSADGTDTMHGIELLQFANGTVDLNANVLVFSTYNANTGIGTLKSSHGTIQSAVTAADADDVIYVRNGTYIEQVTISGARSGLTILGQSEAGVIIQAPNTLASNGVAPSNGRNVNGLITVDSVSDVSIKNLTVDGALKGGAVVGATDPTLVGVAYLNSDDGLIDHVTVTHVREADGGFGNQRNLGIFVSNTNPGGAPTTPTALELAGLNSIEISNTTVTDFQKGGIVVSFADANIHNNTVTGRGVTGLTAQNGIQVAGSTGTVNNNTVTGIGYATTSAIGYGILTFSNRDLVVDTNHVTGTGIATSSGGIAAIGSTGVKVTNNDVHAVVDAIDVYATAGFVDPLAPTATSNPGGVFDFSSNAVDANVPFSVFFRPFATSTDTFNVTGTSRDDEMYGATGVDTLTGGDGNDVLGGRGGADVISGGNGNDIVLLGSGEFVAGETIDGGANADTIRFTSTTASDTLTLTAGVTGIENVVIGDADGVTTGTTALNVNAALVGNALSITGNDGDNTVVGTAFGDTVTANGGNDTITGGNGGDAIDGGAGLDTAVYTTAYAGHTVAWDGTTATVTGSTDTGGAGDTLSNVGKLQFSDKAVWLVNDEVGSEYMTLAQLFDGNAANGEAAAGDIIILDDGTYTGDVTINRAVTILGANAGASGAGSRGAESVIDGRIIVTAGATIDGIKVLNNSNNATQFIGVRIQNTAADVTVRNSVFFSNGPNGSAEDRGINMDTTVTGHVTIASNLFTGAQQLPGDVFTSANWHRGIWSDGGTSQLDITGNTLDHIRSGMNLDGLNNATTNVSGNTFLYTLTGIAIGGNYVGAPSTALTLTAVHDNFFNNAGEDISVQNLTSQVNFDLTATNNTATETGTPVFLVDGGRGTDVLAGTAGNDVLLAHALDNHAGNDSNTLTGRDGDDLLAGAIGTGADTAVYAGTITIDDISEVAADTNPFVINTQAGWQVNGGATEGTDTLTDIEIVDGDGAGKILLVGNGGYASIQAAINAAAAGDTILVASGTYNENLTIDKELTIVGANHGKAGTATRGAETTLNWASGNAVTVTTTAAVKFDGLAFTGKQVTVASTADTNLTFTNSVFELVAGGEGSNNFYMNQPTSFTFTNNKLDATGYTGALFQPVGTPGSAADTTVTFTGNTFTGHAGVAGIDNNVPVIINLSDVKGTVTGNTFSGVDIGVLVANGTGPLEIGNNTFEHMHRTVPNTGSAAGVVFFTPAPFTGTGINIHDNHFNDMDAGVRTSGVPGSTVAGSQITIDDNDFTAVTNVGLQPVGGVLHFTDTTLLPGPTTVVSEFFGGSDNDTIATTAVADIMHGGAGTDTAAYTGTILAADITVAADTNLNTAGNQAGWQVNAGADGVDLLDGMEVVDGLGGGKFLLVGNGGYASIQAAIDAAANGDTILVAGGTYAGDVNVNKGVTILGLQHGTVGTGHSGAESITTGQWTITSATKVVIDGLEFLDNRAYTNSPSDQFSAMTVLSSVNHEVINSVFLRDPNGAANVGTFVGGGTVAPHRALQIGAVGVGGQVTVSGNLFTGDNTYNYGGDNWTTAIYSNGGAGNSVISNNVFEHVRTAINADALTNTVAVSGNTFKNLGTAVSVGVSTPSTVSSIQNNTFDAVDTDFNFRNIPSSNPFAFNLEGTGNALVNPTTDTLYLIGGAGNDDLRGSAGNDLIEGAGGNDTVTWSLGDGNDLVMGDSGLNGIGTDGTSDALVIDNSANAVATSFNLGLTSTSLTGLIGVANLPGTGTTDILVTTGNAADGSVRADAFESLNFKLGSAGDSVTVGNLAGAAAIAISVTGGNGVDTVNSSTSDRRVTFTGGLGNDAFTTGTAGGVFIAGNADGDDTFTGGGTTDTVDYSAVTTAMSVDLAAGIATGAGTDTLTGVENVIATGQADTITVSSTANNVAAGLGNDIILVAAGTDVAGDTLDGGGNTDTIRFISTTAADTLTLNVNTTGIEAVVISDAAGATTGTTALNVNAAAVVGAISLTGNDGDNVLTGNGSTNTIIGGNGGDTIDAGGGSDTVSAGIGDDTVIGTADGVSDIYNGGSGTDTIDYSALTALDSISVNLQTGSASGVAIGSDNLSGSSFENIKSGGGDDSLFGSIANNEIRGGDGSDNIVGGGGSDQLFGDAGNDTLNGGVNDFSLTPSAANDVLWGGTGTDTFRFDGRFGDDAIGAAGTPDWTDNEDMVFVGYAAVAPIIVDVADGVLITVNDGSVASSVFVAGATASQMQILTSGLDLIIH